MNKMLGESAQVTGVSRKAKLAVAAALVVVATGAHAQTSVSLKDVQAAINALVASVNDLSAKVGQLVAAVGTPPAPATFLVTAPIFITDQAAMCSVVNSGSTATSAMITLYGTAGTVLSTLTVSLQPGDATYTAKTVEGTSYSYCRFESAQASQLRGTMAVLVPASTRAAVVVDAK